MKNIVVERNYDEEPIIIKDRMPEISFYIFIIVFLISISIGIFIGYLFNKEGIDWGYLIWYVLFMYSSLILFNYLKMKRNCYIKLYEEKIIRDWDSKLLTINLNNISSVKKTYIDFYDSNQKLLEIYKPLTHILYPFYVLIYTPIIKLVKLNYKLIKKISNKSLYDTIVFFDKDGNMISLFIDSLEQKEEINKYIKNKGFEDIESLSIFYTNQYSPDEITNFFNKRNN